MKPNVKPTQRNPNCPLSGDTENRQLRAYVGVVVLQTTINGSTLFSRRSYQVRLNVRNFGQTPAYKTV